MDAEPRSGTLYNYTPFFIAKQQLFNKRQQLYLFEDTHTKLRAIITALSNFLVLGEKSTASVIFSVFKNLDFFMKIIEEAKASAPSTLTSALYKIYLELHQTNIIEINWQSPPVGTPRRFFYTLPHNYYSVSLTEPEIKILGFGILPLLFDICNGETNKFFDFFAQLHPVTFHHHSNIKKITLDTNDLKTYYCRDISVNPNFKIYRNFCLELAQTISDYTNIKTNILTSVVDEEAINGLI